MLDIEAYQSTRQPRVLKMIAEARKRGEAKHTLTPGAAKVRDFILSVFLRLRGAQMFREAYDYAAAWD